MTPVTSTLDRPWGVLEAFWKSLQRFHPDAESSSNIERSIVILMRSFSHEKARLSNVTCLHVTIHAI